MFSALGLNSSTISVLGDLIAHKNNHFAASQNIFSVSELVKFNITLINQTVSVEIDMWLAFNAKGEIMAYNTTFCLLDWLFDVMT